MEGFVGGIDRTYSVQGARVGDQGEFGRRGRVLDCELEPARSGTPVSADIELVRNLDLRIGGRGAHTDASVPSRQSTDNHRGAH
jgi:hypothetical protein